MRKKPYRLHPQCRRAFTPLLMALAIGTAFLLPADAWAQSVTVNIGQGTLDQAFRQIMKNSKVELVYNTRTVAAIPCDAHRFENQEVSHILDILLRGTDLSYTVQDGIYTIVRRPQPRQHSVQGNVSGVVLDENREPIIGASVLVEGTSQGVITDIDGRFTLRNVTGSDIKLIIRYIGKKDIQTRVKLNSTNEFIMKEDVTMMSEVVVTGYQDISREKVTGSVSTVSAEKLEDRYMPSLMDNLEGRVAGLTTYGDKTTIRGTSSLYASTNPLLVVDGLPIEGSIDDLNPYDIESVTVLKDAAAAAIYGARASNGIIVVKTKGAKEKGKINIDFSANLTVWEKKNMDYAANFYMTPEQQVQTERDFYDWYYFGGGAADPASSVEQAISTGMGAVSPIDYAYYQRYKGIITQEELDARMEQLSQNNFAKEYADHALRNQVLQQYNLAVRSNTEKSSSNLVINYKYDNSGIINAYDNQFNITYKGSYDIAPWLTARFTANGIFNNKQANASELATNPFNVPAYTSLLNEDGSRNYYSTTALYTLNEYYEEGQSNSDFRRLGFNHLEELDYNLQKTRRQNMRYQGELLFKPIEGLTVNAQFVYESERNTLSTYYEEDSYLMRMMYNGYLQPQSDGSLTSLIPENGGMKTTTNTIGNYWTARAQANYSRDFGKHSVNVLAGLEFRETKLSGTNGLMLGYDEQLQNDATATIDFSTLSQMTYAPYVGGGYFPVQQCFYDAYMADAMTPVMEERHRYASGYANLTYTYDNKYNVFASFRKDYADVYGLNAEFRGKPLWSVGAGWSLHNEAFMKDIEWVNFLKLRGSYGVTGNIYQGATSYMTAVTSGNNSVTKLPVSVIESPGNPELKWEQTATTNVGLDFSLLDNRLRGTFDWYHKESKNVFSNRMLDPTTGYTSMFMNTASVKNDGVELSLSYEWFRPQKRRDFGWNTALTFSHNKNTITYVENPSTTASALINSQFLEGYPTSALFSYRFAGINDEGRHTWYLPDGTTTTSISSAPVEAVVYSGQTDPKVVSSMENTFSWNGLSLSVLMVYYGGHKMRALEEQETYHVPYGPVASYFLNAWTPEHPTNTPGIGQWSSTSGIGSEALYTDAYVRPADFLKIRNIVLSYELPEMWLEKIRLQRASVSFQLNNPKWLWVKNKVGIDPETLSLRDPSSFVFGLNINI